MLDFARRLWIKGGRDDIFFLAGGIAFSLLLAAVPFLLLLVSGLGFALNQSADVSQSAAAALIENLLPTSTGSGSLLDPVLRDVARTRGTVGIFSAVAFVWFSTRLFGAMRSVLDRVFELPRGRGILMGKLFDVALTLATAVLTVAWIVLSAYIALARTSGVEALSSIGLHAESVMRPVIYVLGRVTAFVLLAILFGALYKVLPNRAVRWQQAAVGGMAGALLFEVARAAFGVVIAHYNPASLYTGTLAAVVTVVFWVYYAALILILGAEVSHVFEEQHAPLRSAAA